MATIKDIAKLANVSVASVSRVLNHDETMSVSDETRNKIFQIADELGYIKHKKISKVKNKKKIAIVQWYSEQDEAKDLYYYSIRIGIERRALELDYDILRIFNDTSLAKDETIDGIIAIGKYSETQIKELESLNSNLIFVDSDTLNSGHTCVTTDFDNSVSNVLNHFIAHNLLRIGMLAGEEAPADSKIPLVDPRFYRFKNFLTERKLYHPDYVYIGDFTSNSGYELMKKAIEDNKDKFPNAFFVASDAMAIGALRALQEANIKVPDEVSLISFNDTPIAKQVYPQLSSVTVFTEEMGILAMDTLNNYLTSTTPQIPIMLKLATELTLRGSSIND